MAATSMEQILAQQQFDGDDFVGFQQITCTTAQALTVPATASKCIIYAEAAVRYRHDGADTAPTAAVGLVIPAGGTVALVGGLTALRFIGVAAGAKINVEYFA